MRGRVDGEKREGRGRSERRRNDIVQVVNIMMAGEERYRDLLRLISRL